MPKQPLCLDGLVFDSPEEIQFYEYCKELESLRVIEEFEKCEEPFVLCESVKVGDKNKTLLRELTYLPDFRILWKPKFRGIFYEEHWEYTGKLPFVSQESYIDVKGKFASQRNSSAVTFPIKQKMMFREHQIYINKIIPQDLFKMTFVPAPLLFTKTGKKKKWNFKIKLIEEFIHGRTNS